MSILATRDIMTGAERMQALIGGRQPDRVPFMPFASGFAARTMGIDRGEYYRNPDRAFAAGQNLMRVYPWMNSRPSYGWAERGAWEFGGEITWPDNDRYPAPVSLRPVITSPGQVADLADPDPATAGMVPLVARFNEISRRHGYPASLPGGTPTTLTAGVVGRSNFLRWTIRHPDAVHAMQRKVTDFILAVARTTIRTHGAGNCSLFAGVPMESNQLISPETFRTFCKPYITEIFQFYRRQGVKSALIHLCGDHTRNLREWRDIPVPPRAIFSIGHEMDIAATAVLVGAEYIVAGNLNNAILQNGTAEEVYAEARRCLAAGMGHPGGFILMPACEFPPNTPSKNLQAIERALADHGFYS
jgi:uroporphyrinogen decarboxylase